MNKVCSCLYKYVTALKWSGPMKKMTNYFSITSGVKHEKKKSLKRKEKARNMGLRSNHTWLKVSSSC
jgi:hypothetical protein